MKACMLYFSISTAINYVSLTKHFMHIYKVEVLWYVTLFMLLTTGSLMDCHQNCLWNVKFVISNAHNYLCRIQECWKKNSAMTIILKIISWRKYLPRNRKLTCSSKNSVISGVIVTWTKLHPLKQSNVWKKKLEYLDQCQTTPFPLIVKLAKSDDPLLNQLCSVLELYVVTSQAALRQFCTVSQRGVNAPLSDKKNSGTPAEFHFLVEPNRF